jgi:hypothetical protein
VAPATAPTTTPGGTFTGADWTGVYQTVTSIRHPDGSAAKAPKATTKISVAGSQPTTVEVPVADSSVTVKHAGHFKAKTPAPKVDNGLAQVNLAPDGIADEELSSNFDRPLPVSVSVTYQLNGKTIPTSDARKSLDALKGKSGTVEVTYKLTNTSSAPVSACFQGFDGQPQHITVPTPVPMFADLSLTVPQGVTSFSAPGATLTTAKSGVSVGWTQAMFQPLGDVDQTFTLTMNSASASVPRATLLLLALNPQSISGQVPASSAAALGTAESAVNKGISSVQGALDSLQQHMSGFQSSRSSSAPSGGLGPVSLPPSSDHGISVPRITLPAITLPTISLPTANSAAPSVPPTTPTVTLPSITAPSISLPSLVSPDLGALQTDVVAIVNHLDAKAVTSELATLGTYLSTAAADTGAISAAAGAVTTLATSLNSAVTGISAAFDALVASVPATVQNAQLQLQHLDHITKVALPAFNAADQHTPAFLELAAEVAAAQSLAAKISDALMSLGQGTEALTQDFRALRDQTTALVTNANALEAAAAEATAQATPLLRAVGTGIASDVESRVANAGSALDAVLAKLSTAAATATDGAKAQLASAQAAVQGYLATVTGSASQAVQNAQANAMQAVAGAKAGAAGETAHLRQAVSTAKASISQAVAEASQQAGEAIQSSEQAAQAQLAQSTDQVQNAVAKANSDYAALLCLNEQAALNVMPAGAAKGATAQNGVFVYVIEGS